MYIKSVYRQRQTLLHHNTKIKKQTVDILPCAWVGINDNIATTQAMDAYIIATF